MLCPRCDYDLTGLPAVHTCPECGCNYDEHSMGIPLTGRRKYFWTWVAVALNSFLMFRSVQRAGPGLEILRRFVVPAMLFLAIFIHWRRHTNLPTRLILDRDGIELATLRQVSLRWFWAMIRTVEVDWVWGYFRIKSHDGTVLISRHYSSFGTLKLAKYSAAEINRRVEMYSSRGAVEAFSG